MINRVVLVGRMTKDAELFLDTSMINCIGQTLKENLPLDRCKPIGHGHNTPTIGRTPNHDAVQTISSARMAYRIMTRNIIFLIVDVVYKLLQTKSISFLISFLNQPPRSLHHLGTFLRYQSDTLVFAIVHVHHHIDRQVVCRNLYTSRW